MNALNINGKNFNEIKIMNMVLTMHLVWSILRSQIPMPGILNGIGIFLFPVIEVLLILYCYLKTQFRLVMPYVLLVVLFNVYMIIRHCFSGDFMSHGASDCYTFFFSLFCLMSLSKEDFIDRFYIFCLTAFILSIAVSLISYLTLVIPFAENPVPGGRLQGILPNPNTLGHVATYGYVLGIGAFLVKSEKKNLLFVLFADTLLTIKVLLDCESRASMLFLCVAIFGLIIGYFIWFRKALPVEISKILFLLILVVLAIALIAFILFIISDTIRCFILDLMRVPYDENSGLVETMKSIMASFSSASNRDVLRSITIRHWKENLLFGVSAARVVSDFTENIDQAVGSHNSFLQIGATLGIIGLVLFLLMYILSFVFSVVSAIKAEDNRIKTISVFVAIFFVALSVDVNFENLLYMSLAMMALVGYFIICSGLQLGRFLKKNE